MSWFPIQLALRHRPNKHGAQRIVSFVGSPVLDDDRSLKRLADTLRKNTVRGRGGGQSHCGWTQRGCLRFD